MYVDDDGGWDGGWIYDEELMILRFGRLDDVVLFGI